MMKRRWVKRGVVGCLCVLGLLALTSLGAAQEDADAQAKIENAMSAAPMSIAQDATILDFAFDTEGNFIVLREGSNSWTCFPDDPSTPSNDPVCYDPVWMQLLQAFFSGTTPNITTPGFAYMLQGGGSASNTNPMAVTPEPGEDWMVEPPHIMVLMPGDVDLSAIGTDMNSGKPWVMWAGTPFQHIMVPVAAAGDSMSGMSS